MAGRPCHHNRISPSILCNDVLHTFRPHACSFSKPKCSSSGRRKWQQPVAGKKSQNQTSTMSSQHKAVKGQDGADNGVKMKTRGGYDINPLDDIITSGLFDNDPLDKAITSAILDEVDASKKAGKNAVGPGGIKGGAKPGAMRDVPTRGPVRARVGKKSIIRRKKIGIKEKMVIKNSQVRVDAFPKHRPRRIMKEAKRVDPRMPNGQQETKKNVELLAKPGLPVKVQYNGWLVDEAPKKVNYIDHGGGRASSADWVPFQGVLNNKFGARAGPTVKTWGGRMSRDQTASASTSGNTPAMDISKFQLYGRESRGHGVYIPKNFSKKFSKDADDQPEPSAWDALCLADEDAIRRGAHQISKVVSTDLGVEESVRVESSIDDSMESTLDEMDAPSEDGLSENAKRKILGIVSKLPSAGRICNELEELAQFEMSSGWRDLDDDSDVDAGDAVIEDEGNSGSVSGISDLNLMAVLVLVNQLSRNGGPKVAMMVLDVLRGSDKVVYPTNTLEVYKELLRGCDMCANGPLAMEILKLMEGQGIELDVTSYNYAISAHAKTANIEKVQELFEAMASEGLTPNSITYNRVLLCAERAQDWESGLEIYGAMRSRDVPRTAFTYRSLMRVLTGANKNDLALKCLEWMGEDAVAPNDLVFDVLIRHFLGKHKDIDTAMGLIRSAEGFGVVFELNTLRRFVEWALNRSNMDLNHVMGVIELMRETGTLRLGNGSNGSGTLRNSEVRVLYRIYYSLLAQMEANRELWEACVKIYSYMKEDNLTLDQKIMKKMISTCWNAGQLDMCISLYKEARSKGLHKNITVAFGVCCAMAMQGQWEDVDVVLQEMRDHDIIDNPGIYVSLMNIAGTKGDLDRGSSIFEQATLHLGHDQSLFNAVIRCHSYKPSEALEFYQQMRQAGIRGDRSTYMTLITAASKEVLIPEMTSIWRSMISSGIMADSGLYNTLLSGYYNAGMLKESLEVYEQMCKTLLPTKSYTFRTVTRLLQNHGSAESAEKAQQVLDWLYNTTGTASFTYSAAVENCKRNPEWQHVVDVFEGMHYVKIRPQEHTFQLLLGLCAQKGEFDKAMELRTEIEENGIPMSLNLMNALLMCCASVGNLRKGEEIIADAKEHGITPDVASFSILIDSCCHPNVEMGWREALDLFIQMQKRGVAPNTVLYNALLKVSIEKGKVNSTMEMLAHMQRHSKCAPDKSTYSMVLGMLAKEEQWKDACQLFLEAKQQGVWMAFSFGKDGQTMDLHGMSQHVAEVALRTWLHHLRRGAMENRRVDGRLIKIVTGWGCNSETLGQTKLKPVVEKLFQGSLGPVLAKSALSIPSTNQGLYHIQTDVFYSWLLQDELDLGIDKKLDVQMGPVPVSLQ